MLRGYHVYQDISVGEEYCQGGIFFVEHNFRGWRPICENRENYAPRKFGAIRYCRKSTGNKSFPGSTSQNELYRLGGGAWE